MKKTLLLAAACMAFAATACSHLAETQDSALQKKQNMEKVCAFLKDAGHYFIATVDGDQPRVRPFGTIHIYDGRLYVQTGKKKNVSKQLGKNGKVELCALKDDTWIRVSGTLVNDDSVEAKASLLDAYPSLKEMYSAEDENTQVLYFTNGLATIYSFTADPVELPF